MSDKSFKVKSGLIVPGLTTAGIVKTDSSGVLSSSATLGISEGGTGQTTAGNALNALLPLQTGNENKYLQTNGVSTQWNSINLYLAPTLGSTLIPSNTTVTAINGLTKIVSASHVQLDANSREQDISIMNIMQAW